MPESEAIALHCALCNAAFTGILDDAIDAGWIPDYFDGEECCEGPVCPECTHAKLTLTDDGWVVPSADTPTTDQPSADRSDRLAELLAESDRIAERMDVFNRTGRYPPEA